MADEDPSQENGAQLDQEPPQNTTLLQGFEWYCPPTQSHYRHLRHLLPSLAHLGVTHLWLPPGCKAGHSQSNGYDIYDLYDLGEFEQKGSRSTKWGSKEDLVELAWRAKEAGIGVIWDAVLNHKAAADGTDVVKAVQCDPKDRLKEISEPQDIEAWVRYDFPVRGDVYSSMKYHADHFSGTDYDSRTQSKAIFKFVGEGWSGWAKDVDRENGNADYLMFADVAHSHPDVQRDILNWSTWLPTQLPIAGIRFDAVKHFSSTFLKALLDHLDATDTSRNWLLIGEYCVEDVPTLHAFIAQMQGRLCLFDFTLQSRLVGCSRAVTLGPNDLQVKSGLRHLLHGTLTGEHPDAAVAFATNHDTQARSQPHPTTIAPTFLPQAHALILLHHLSHRPCIFYGDLYGVDGPAGYHPPDCAVPIAKLMLIRKLYAYGEGREYHPSEHALGFTRAGRAGGGGGGGGGGSAGSGTDGAGCAVLIANEEQQASAQLVHLQAEMHVGVEHSGERWTDALQTEADVVVDAHGWGVFALRWGMCAVWVWEDAAGRADVDALHSV